MSILANLEKYKRFFTAKKRFFLVNIIILTSLMFVILKNISQIRYKTIQTEDGILLTLDRFTSKIKVTK